MSESPIAPDLFRRASEEIARAAEQRDEIDPVSQVIAEVLLDQAEHRTAMVARGVIDAKMNASGLTAAHGATPLGKPLEILRSGARTPEERALVTAYLARHLQSVLERRDGVHAFKLLLNALDWLEFVGLYPPYSALRHSLTGDALARYEATMRGAPVDGPSALATDAIRVLRGNSLADAQGPYRLATQGDAAAHVSVTGEVEGFERAWVARVLGTITGWSALTGATRTALRVVFSLRRPCTVTLDGTALRVHGRTEILGRTVRSFDLRLPLANLTEVRRETRFPMLPVSASVFALSVGSILGAKYVVEGARAPYFPLIGIGLGLLSAGILFDFLMRALFPGLEGKVRLTVRAREARGIVFTRIALDDVEKLLRAIEGALNPRTMATASWTLGDGPAPKPLLSGPAALVADTIRDPGPPTTRPTEEN